MADKQTKKHHSEKSNNKSQNVPPLPKSYDHRASMKWITIESLRIALERTAGTAMNRVSFLTPVGLVEGELTDIAPSYAESFELADGERFAPDVTSMVANLRIDMLRMMEQQENQLELVDAAPLIGLKNVKIHSAGQLIEMSELTLFADQITGFSVSNQSQH